MNFKEINKLALPAIIAGIAEPVITLVDTAIIGHLGTIPLAGVGIGSSLFVLLVWALAQTKTAISAIVSQYLGKGEIEQMGSFVSQTFLLNFMVGLLTVSGSLLFLDEIFTIYNAEGQTLAYAKEYYNIRVWGLPLSLCIFGLYGAFRGLQNTKWAMKISLTGGLINLVLDIVLVYGIDGLIPSFGVEGAAWASIISQLYMISNAIYIVVNKSLFPKLFSIKIHSELKRFSVMFLNLLIRTVAMNVAYFLGTKFATSYGTESIAAHTIAMNIWLFSSFFIDGYASAGNAIAGKLLGQKNNEGIYTIGKTIYLLTMAVGAGLGLCYLAGYTLIGQFFTTDPLVLTTLANIFWMVIISQPLNGMAFGLDGIFKGVGRTALLRNLLLIASFLGFIPTIYITDYFGMGLHGVWTAFLIFMAIRGLGLLFIFNRDFRPKLQV